MALEIHDRVKETTTTTGTGTYTLAGAVTGFETFTANLDNSDTTYYACTDNTDFEIGIGTFTSSGTTLARTTILASSNSNNAVNWSSGTRTIFMTYPASKAVFLDASGNLSIGADLTVGDDLFISGGLIDLKNDGSFVSQIKFYCESSNAHAQTLIGAPHSESASNTLTLPSSGGSSKLLSATSTATVTNKSIDSDNNTITNIVNADIKSSAAIADSKLATISTAGKVAISALDIDGGTDIGANLADADEIIVDDGGGGTNRRSDMSRVKTYIADVTLTTAAQTNITSLGTLTALTVDDVAIDGKVITMTGSSGDTATITAGTNGTLDIATTDGGGAAGNIQITADGTAELAGTTVTLDSSGGITLDADGGTITFADAGSSLGTITSSGYSGTAAVATTVTITDNESTNEENAVVFTAGGDVDGGNIGLESDGDLTYNPSTGTVTATIFKGNIDAVDGDFDGTLEADAITVNGTALNTVIADEATALAIALGQYMANTFKLKTDTNVTGAATIYTVGGSTTTVILGLILGNTTTSQVTATVTLENNDGDNVALVTNAPIPAGSSLEMLAGNKVVMETSDVLKVAASGATDVALSIMEIT